MFIRLRRGLRRRLHLFAFTAVLCFFNPAIAWAERITFPSVGLSLDIPESFEKSDRFIGVQQNDTGASIVLVSIPGPYKQVSAGMTQQNLSRRKMLLHEQEPVTIGNTKGLLLDVEQSAYGRTFRKWILIWGNESTTHLITANYPAEMIVSLNLPLKKAVMSAQEIKGGPVQAPLPFAITPIKEMKPIAGMSSLGKMLAYSSTGKLPRAFPGEAMFMVAPSLGAVPIEDHKKAALSRLNSLADIRVRKVTLTDEVTIDNMPGIRMHADGINKGDLPISVFMVMLFPKAGGYFLLTGLVGADNDNRDTSMTNFEKLSQSFKRKP